MAELLPLPGQMELIKGRKTPRQEPRNEQKFRFPALEETWEVSCCTHEEWNERTAGNKKADPKAGLYDIAS